LTDKKNSPGSAGSSPEQRSDRSPDALADQFFQGLQADGTLPAESREILSAALKAMKSQSVDADTETSLQDLALESQRTAGSGACDICGHQNRPGNQFCGMCGLPLPEFQGTAPAARAALPAKGELAPASAPMSQAAHAPGHHFYHHHYHHHYFANGVEAVQGAMPSANRAPAPEATRDPSRVRTPGSSQPMSRAEVSVRKLMQDWALACNTKHLEDLTDIYASDALVLRPNHPPVRGTAAIREYFVATLDSGFGEAELDPIRLEVFGDIAFEAGRCKALVPIAVNKRREERGKYVTLMARQSNSEWKIIADCWSSDLSLSMGEMEGKSGLSTSATAKPGLPRK